MIEIKPKLPYTHFEVLLFGKRVGYLFGSRLALIMPVSESEKAMIEVAIEQHTGDALSETSQAPVLED